MSDIMRPIPFPDLINWINSEYKNEGSVFGIRSDKFFHPSSFDNDIFSKKISAPIGLSGGPGTQLSQNMLSGFLAGARCMELKTVQPMDGEDVRTAVSRPSINTANEGYNVEWTNELTVTQLMDEYIKAWFLCHIFAVEYKISEAADLVFTMSVGYSLDGIKSEKVNSYIEGMRNAANTESWARCYDYISANISSFSHFTKADLEAISPEISNSIIVSTFYNCPGDETEKMASYFLDEKKLHTMIKCNPTLLGYETIRALLDVMGYDYITFTEHHFKNEIHLYDAVKIFKHLRTLALKDNLVFGVKLTNSFPVEIKRNELPGHEMYMSGRPLFPLSIHTAKKISESFHGELPVSFSGGADFFNLKSILETGIKPVTMVTNILKPGGLERFTQLANIACENSPGNKGINLKALSALCDQITENKRYLRDFRRGGERKISSVLPIFDCAVAPCVSGCPININIPQFLIAAAAEDYSGAFKLITMNNTAPSVTGSLCDHKCQQKCTRIDYEDPLQIKIACMTCANHAQDDYILSLTAPKTVTKSSVGIIGAGPAGIAAAVFLRRNGVPVTVYEKREKPFGAVQYAIPSFRIPDDAIERDYQMALKTGVEFVFNAPPQYSVDELKKKHKFVIIATGTWKEGVHIVKKGQENILDAMSFLEEAKKTDYNAVIGKKVAVVGGGRAAIDCARAAKRNKGVESVTIIYRRTREFMPALHEDQELAIADKVIIRELLIPETWEDGILTCEEMILGDYDSSGRRSIKATDKRQKLKFNTVISAVEARIEKEPFDHNRILFDGDVPMTNSVFESSVFDVYIAGGCRTGSSTVANAIADGKTAAADILKKLKIKPDFSAESVCAIKTASELYCKKGVIREAKNDIADGERCLSCNKLCEICADVCLKRANVSVLLPASGGKAESRQILHIDSMCNECGNCASFCPHDGKPYREKLTLFAAEDDFLDSENPGFLKTGDTYKVRLEDGSVVNYHPGGKNIPHEWSLFIDTVAKNYEWLFVNFE